jgi:hypothetical protein
MVGVCVACAVNVALVVLVVARCEAWLLRILDLVLVLVLVFVSVANNG